MNRDFRLQEACERLPSGGNKLFVSVFFHGPESTETNGLSLPVLSALLQPFNIWLQACGDLLSVALWLMHIRTLCCWRTWIFIFLSDLTVSLVSFFSHASDLAPGIAMFFSFTALHKTEVSHLLNCADFNGLKRRNPTDLNGFSSTASN